jgi:predicted SnoaL-like aldol condensation-catalyzing enzyme
MKTPLRAAMVCILAVATAPTVGFAANTPEEAANKQLVLDYYRDIQATVSAGKMSELSKVDAKYRDPGYIQHSVGGGQGGRATQGRGGAAPEGGPGTQGARGDPRNMGPPRLLSIMAEGDLVNQVTIRTIPGADGKSPETIIFNLFRVKNGKLIEHWDAFGVPSNLASSAAAPK